MKTHRRMTLMMIINRIHAYINIYFVGITILISIQVLVCTQKSSSCHYIKVLFAKKSDR